MKERLITYSPDMVLAKRAGMKTMTRRVMSHQISAGGVLQMAGPGYCEIINEHGVHIPGFHCPYGEPGDILLTREAWRADAMFDGLPPRDIPQGAFIAYEAGDQEVLFPASLGRYRHARFMCRWMCRDRDEITEVRVERLQDISEADAIAEGIDRFHIDSMKRQQWRVYPHTDGDPREEVVTYCGKPYTSNPIESYKSLWLSLNGPGSWDLNPYVWVVSFKRIES